MPPGDSCLPGPPPEESSTSPALSALSDEEIATNLVPRLKKLADDLKNAGYPLYAESDTHDTFPEDIRAKADELNNALEDIMGDVQEVPSSSVQMHELAKYKMNQNKVVRQLRIVLAQGQTLEEFRNLMKSLDFSQKCNSVWENDAVAYRCNTCALTPCMSLCALCFSNGNHEGHDFTRFFSREGGACDCGNSDVLKPIGFCKEHGPNAKPPPPQAPTIVSLPEVIITRLFTRLFIRFRGWYVRFLNGTNTPADVVTFSENQVKNSDELIEFLQEILALGGPVREAMARILLDKQLYTELTKRTSAMELAEPNRERIPVNLDWRTRHSLQADVGSLCDSTKFASGGMQLRDDIAKFECLMDEMIFWIIRLVFPQSLINLSLGMMSDDVYRDRFSDRFFTMYPCSVNLMKELCECNPNEVNGIAAKVIHISVQMLSSEALCLRLDSDVSLINTVLSGLLYLMNDNLKRSRMTMAPIHRHVRQMSGLAIVDSFWETLNEETSVFNGHGYWFVMGDLQNVLSHTSLAIRLVHNFSAFEMCYLVLIKRMQGINHFFRLISGDHRVSDAADQYQRSFTLEFEVGAISMQNIVQAILQQNRGDTALCFLSGVKRALEEWLFSLNFPTSFSALSCHPFSVSFHLPLHRHLSYALSNFYNMPEFREVAELIRKDEGLLKKIILHPLRIQVVRTENLAGMWVRNGNQMRVQATLYAQQHLHSAFMTPDINLIRFCAANLPPNWVWDCILESFHLFDVFEWTTQQRRSFCENFTRFLRFRVLRATELSEEEARVRQAEEEQKKAAVRSSTVSGAGSSSLLNVEELMDTSSDTQERTLDPNESVSLFEILAEGPFVLQSKPDCRQMKLMEARAKLADKEKNDDGVGSPMEVDQALASGSIVDDLLNEAVTLLDNLPSWSYKAQQIHRTVPGVGRLRPNGGNTVPIQSQTVVRTVMDLDDDGNEILNAQSLEPNPNGPVSDINYDIVQSQVIQRPEWIDPLLSGAFRMIATMVVCPGSDPSNLRESIRDELVHLLSNDDQPYSKLKNCIPERGVKYSGRMDSEFDEVLNQVAEFREPDLDDKMRQGVFRLRPESWRNYFCPVFCQMRAITSRTFGAVFARVEKLESDLYKGEFKQNGGLWIPYRLIDFTEKRHHESMSGIYRLIVCDRFFEMAAITIKTFSTTSVVKDTTLQLVVYLLSLSVKYACTLPEDKKQQVFLKFRRLWNYRTITVETKEEESVDGETKQVKVEVETAGTMSVFNALYAIFMDQIMKKGNYGEFLAKLVKEEPENRIVGTAAEYIGRLFQLLYRNCPFFKSKFEVLIANSTKASQSPRVDDPETKEKEDKRLAAKRRREALLARTQKKNAETMKRLMQSEGISQKQMDAIDTTQHSVRLYECPICNDSSPSTMNQPVGLLVRIMDNGIIEQQLPTSADKGFESLLELDKVSGLAGTSSPTMTKEHFLGMRTELAASVVMPGRVFLVNSNTSVTLRTCGHYAHLECFKQFSETVPEVPVPPRYLLLHRNPPCPLCRFPVNAQLPLAIDRGFSPMTSETKNFTPEIARNALIESMAKWRSIVKRQVPETAPSGLYKECLDRISKHVFNMNMINESMNVANESPLNSIAALIKANVERNVLYAQVNVPERRKNTRTLITEHLLYGLAASISRQEFEIFPGSVRDLLTPSDSLPPLNDVAEPAPGPSSITGNEMDSDRSTVRSAFEESEFENMDADMQDFMSSRLSNTTSTLVEKPLDAKYGLPLLLYDIKAFLVKLTAFIATDDSLTSEGKKELYVVIASFCMKAQIVKSVLMLIARGSYQCLEQFALGNLVAEKYPWLRTIARVLLKSKFGVVKEDFCCLDERQSTVEGLFKCYVDELASVCDDFLLFVSQLWKEAKISENTPADLQEWALQVKQLLHPINLESPVLIDEVIMSEWINHASALISLNVRTHYRGLTEEPISYRPFPLLKLPASYDEIFSRYFNRPCNYCTKVPSNPFVCLVCSELLCPGECCRALTGSGDNMTSSNEVMRHIDSCGARSDGIFLSLNSSLICIVKTDGRCGVWGSVFLDAHGEEDRNLRRGKPLFLSEKRYKALENDWCEKDFDRALSQNFGTFEQMMMHVRESHYMLR